MVRYGGPGSFGYDLVRYDSVRQVWWDRFRCVRARSDKPGCVLPGMSRRGRLRWYRVWSDQPGMVPHGVAGTGRPRYAGIWQVR